MRQMLGMPGGKFINLPKGWEAAKEKENARFKEMWDKDLTELDADEFGEYVDVIEDAAKTRLASFQEIAWYFANRREGLNSRPLSGRLLPVSVRASVTAWIRSASAVPNVITDLILRVSPTARLWLLRTVWCATPGGFPVTDRLFWWTTGLVILRFMPTPRVSA